VRAEIPFNEKIRIFTEALQGRTAEERISGLLNTTLGALNHAAGRGPYSTETIHALSLALAKLPTEALAILAEENRTRIKSLSEEIEYSVERLSKKLRQFDKEELKSGRISPEMNIDHRSEPPYIFLHLASCEAILRALSWVYEPPLEAEQQ
jgi:hypothetical protein